VLTRRAGRLPPTAALVAAGVLLSATAAAQAPRPALADETVAADPIRCWWRTSTGAVKVGEPFDLVLTCAVLETRAVTVVPDQARLDPSAIQLAPFEVLGGTHADDVRTATRRFFQYEYSLRIISDELFGQDVNLPQIGIEYRIRSHLPEGTAVEGRDRTYTMPPASVRVVSLVPSGAFDIRDGGSGSFVAIERRTFRGWLLTVAGATLMFLGIALGVTSLARLARQGPAGRAVPVEAPVANRVILRGVARELAAVRRAREDGGWNDALAGRTLAALRIVASVAADHPVSVRPDGRTGADEGLLVTAGRWPRRRAVRVSASVTPATLRHAMDARTIADDAARAETLAPLVASFEHLTAIHYARDGHLDEGALDEALSTAIDVSERGQDGRSLLAAAWRRRLHAIGLERTRP